MTVFRSPQPFQHGSGLWIVVTSQMQPKWQLNYTSKANFYLEFISQMFLNHCMSFSFPREAIHVPFMAKFVVFAKRTDPLEARLRVFCMTDDREDKTLEHQEHYTEVAKSRDVEVLEDKIQFIELAGNLVPITKSGEQLKLTFKAFRENRLPFAVRVKDQHADIVGRALFMREPKVAKGEPPQQPICILNVMLPENIIPEQLTILDEDRDIITRIELPPQEQTFSHISDLRIVDISNLLGEDWIRLAPEIGISKTDVDLIIEENPSSTAKQAQAMLVLFQSRKQNDINILENGLRTIERDDIVNQCIKNTRVISTTTTTVTTTKRGYSVVSKNASLDHQAYDEPDIMKDSESVEELVQQDDIRHELKYSAEEKIVEKSESEEESDETTVQKTVAERRTQIQKRLSTEKSKPSEQKKEIQEEIVEIKRRSLIEETKSKHEEEILMQKPTDNSYKTTSSGIPEPVARLKTSTSKDGSMISKTEFDQELQDKFKTTLKDVESFEHVPQATATVYQISVESTDSEKRDVYDIGKDHSEKTVTDIKETTKQISETRFTSEESTESTKSSDNGLTSIVTKSTITTITTGEPTFTIHGKTYDEEKAITKEEDKYKELHKEVLSSVDTNLMSKLTEQKEKVETIQKTGKQEHTVEHIRDEKISFQDLEKQEIRKSSLEQEVKKQIKKEANILDDFIHEESKREPWRSEEVTKEEVVHELKKLDEVIKEEAVKVEKKLEEKFDEITKGSQLITPAGKTVPILIV